MTEQPSHLESLITLAREPSSEKRRELLRNITDIFMEKPESYSEVEIGHFGDIMSAVAAQMETEVRKELAQRMSHVEQAPRTLITQLAQDEIAVAEPVLQHSPVLQDEDLIEIVRRHSQDHLLAITGRRSLSVSVGDALVEHGDDAVLAGLVSNDGAELSRHAMETIVDRAENNTDLHEPLVSRRDLPPDLLNEMYFFVSRKIRQKILESNAKIDEKLLDEALAHSRRKWQQEDDKIQFGELTEAKKFVNKLIKYNELNERKLVELFNTRRFNEFMVAFAHLSDMDVRTVRRLMSDESCEGLAIACRALGFDRSTFSAFALQPGMSNKNPANSAYKAVELYDQIPVETAQRTIRFWRVRKGAQASSSSSSPANAA